MHIMKKFSFTLLALLATLSMVRAQEVEADAPYQGGSGDGYAMAELLVNSQPTALDKALEQATRLYPNPLKKGDQLMLQIPTTVQIDRIRLIDSQGNLLMEKGLKELATAKAILYIPILNWPAGIYFLELESRQTTITKKLILL